MSRINVMVTGVGGGGVGEQILKCLRMSSLEYNIIGCDMNRNSMGLSKADKAYLVPPASYPHYVESILQICKENAIQVLFHGSEPEMKVLSRNRQFFKDEGIFIPLNPEDVIEKCMDKYLTMRFLQESGFAIQKFWEVREENDLQKIDTFPVVLKPSVGGGGSVNTFIAQNREELELFGKYLLKIYNQFTVQEYIGKSDSEYTVGVLHASSGEYINSIAVKKNIMSGLSNKTCVPNRTGRQDLGETLAISSGISQGEIGRFEEVTAPCRKIAKKLGCTAALNIQCRIHNEQMYVFEINPRISGTSSLRAIVGYNEPDILIREKILGEEIKPDFSYKSGYIARGLSERFISHDFMSGLEYSKISSGEGYELLSKADEPAYMQYILDKEDTLIYVSLKYRNMLEELLNDKSYYLVAKVNNEIKGVLPILIHKSEEYGNVANSLPFYGSNGAIIADDSSIYGYLLKAYYQLLAEHACVAGTLITSPFEKNNSWYKESTNPTFIDTRIGQITYLPKHSDNDAEALLSLYHKMVRRCIKKAVNNNISVEIDNSTDGVDFLYKTHKENIESIGGIAKKQAFFSIFPKHFQASEDYNIYVAYKDGKRVAALLVFYFNKTVEYFTPVTVEEYRTFQPLSLIIYIAMQEAVEKGFERWNWGGTWLTQNGVYDFKRKWGTTDLNYYYYTNIFDKRILNFNQNVILQKYENYYVYPFNRGVKVDEN